MTRHEKIGLMCTYNLTTFWNLKFHNSVLKHSVSLKLLLLVKQTMGNFMQFTKCVATSYRKGEISGIMRRGVFCAHKPYFLMPGHI